jgi:hypothetical protein
MATYPPPTSIYPIFDRDSFSTMEDTLTIEEADKRYLRFPFAQGTENLQAVNINGALVANNTATLNNTLSVSGITTLEDALVIEDTTNSTTIDQSGTSFRITNDENSGTIEFITKDNLGVPITSLSASASGATVSGVLSVDGSTIDVVGTGLIITNDNNLGNIDLVAKNTVGATAVALSATHANTTVNNPLIASSSLTVSGVSSLNDQLIINDGANNSALDQVGTAFQISNDENSGTIELRTRNSGGTYTTPISASSATTTITGTNLTLTTTNPPTCSALQPAFSDSSDKMPTTAWVQGAITNSSGWNVIGGDTFTTYNAVVGSEAPSSANRILIVNGTSECIEFNNIVGTNLQPIKPRPLNTYSGTTITVTNETQLVQAGANALDGDTILVANDIVLISNSVNIARAAKLTAVNKNIKISTSALTSVVTTSVSTSGILIEGITIENSGASSVVSCVTLNGNAPSGNQFHNCTFITNEFAIVSANQQIQVTNCDFRFIGTPVSFRYISLSRISGTTIIDNCTFSGNGGDQSLASSRCIQFESGTFSGNLVFTNNNNTGLNDIAQVLNTNGIVPTTLNIYAINNNFKITNGFLIIFGANPSNGYFNFFLFNNVQILGTQTSSVGSKGLVGFDGVGSLTNSFFVYAGNNTTPVLRSDYFDMTKQRDRTVAYSSALNAPTFLVNLLEIPNDLRIINVENLNAQNIGATTLMASNAVVDTQTTTSATAVSQTVSGALTANTITASGAVINNSTTTMNGITTVNNDLQIQETGVPANRTTLRQFGPNFNILNDENSGVVNMQARTGAGVPTIIGSYSTALTDITSTQINLNGTVGITTMGLPPGSTATGITVNNNIEMGNNELDFGGVGYIKNATLIEGHNSSNLEIKAKDGDFKVFTHNASNVDTERITVKDISGYVGINDKAPTASLTVKGLGLKTNEILMEIDSSSGADRMRFRDFGSGGDAGKPCMLESESDGFGIACSGSGGPLSFWTTAAGGYSNLINRMNISTQGNITMSTPSEGGDTLTVNGDLNITGNYKQNGSAINFSNFVNTFSNQSIAGLKTFTGGINAIKVNGGNINSCITVGNTQGSMELCSSVGGGAWSNYAIQNGDAVIRQPAARRLILQNGAGDGAIVIDANNNVAIGANGGTQYKFAVTGEAQQTGALILQGGTTTYQHASVDIGNRTNTYLTLGFNGSNDDWCYMRQIGGANAYHLAFDIHDDDDPRFSIRSVKSTDNPDTIRTAFTVQNTNVGINTASPAQNLEIVAPNVSGVPQSATLLLRSEANSLGRIFFGNSNHYIARGPIVSTLTDGNDLVTRTAGTGSIGFVTENTERMRVAANGNVGINRSNPTYTLDVNGNINYTGNIYVNGSLLNIPTVVEYDFDGGTYPYMHIFDDLGVEQAINIRVKIRKTGDICNIVVYPYTVSLGISILSGRRYFLRPSSGFPSATLSALGLLPNFSQQLGIFSTWSSAPNANAQGGANTYANAQTSVVMLGADSSISGQGLAFYRPSSDNDGSWNATFQAYIYGLNTNYVLN